MHAGSFGSISPSHAGSRGQFAHGGNFGGRPGSTFAGRAGSGFAGRAGSAFAGRYGNNFAGRSGNWAGNHAWDNYFRRGGYGGYGAYGGYAGWGGYGGYGGWGWGGYGLGWGGYWPWYGGWGLALGSWGYPNNYGYYYPDASYYSYTPNDYSTYVPSDYYSSSAPSVYVDGSAVANQQFADSSAIAPTIAEEGSPAGGPAQDQSGTSEAMKFYSESRTAFLHGDYQNALRLATHAAVDAPQNAKVHELISLALFALGNYGPAAGEAHAAMALGTLADWSDLYAYYNNAEKYTTQLRALETAAAANPKDAADHFLLGYHYLMIGARDNAKTQFAGAVKLAPNDKLAGHYLQELQSNAPLTPPQMASKPQGREL
jgi:hypothetical protein